MRNKHSNIRVLLHTLAVHETMIKLKMDIAKKQTDKFIDNFVIY